MTEAQDYSIHPEYENHSVGVKTKQVENDIPDADGFSEFSDSGDIQSLIDELNNRSGTIKLETPETTASNASKCTYRGRFMAGKEEEYDATIEAYANSVIDKKGNHRKALRECRTYASIRRDFATGDVKVFGDSCRNRWCPMCAGQKTAYAKEQSKMYIDSLPSPKFLTLTIRHSESDLKTQVEFLQERFRALRSRAYWKKNVRGGIWFLQVKRGSGDNLWHPHLHILLDSNRMECTSLSGLWEQVTYGSPIIDLQYVHDHDAMAEYVARYTARPAMLKESCASDRTEIIEALFRKRMCGTFGNAKAVTLTPPKVEATGDWDYVGHYDDIVERSAYCPLSKLILIAYNTGQPLPDHVYRDFTGRPPGPIEHVIKPPKIDKQMYLDFYNS